VRTASRGDVVEPSRTLAMRLVGDIELTSIPRGELRCMLGALCHHVHQLRIAASLLAQSGRSQSSPSVASPGPCRDGRVCCAKMPYLVCRASRGRTLPREARKPSRGANAILVRHACKLHVASRLWETLDLGTGHRVPEVQLRPKSEKRNIGAMGEPRCG
jgi:hypothetical protein